MRPLYSSGKTQQSWMLAMVSVGALGSMQLGCDSASFNAQAEMLTVAMVGVFERSPDADGNAEPRKIEFTLTGVQLLSSDGSTVDLWEDADPVTVKVVSRPQIIFEKDIGDQVGTTFSGLRLSFDPSVTGTGKYERNMTVMLAHPKPEFTQSLTVEKGKSLDITANVQWKDVITRDTASSPPTETMTPPSFRFSIEDQ